MLGSLDVARPAILQILPTVFLFYLGSVAIIGVCVPILERIYSAYRASIVVRRWLLTGKHTNHLKLVPGVSKQVRRVLYMTTLIAGGIAILALLIPLASHGLPRVLSTFLRHGVYRQSTEFRLCSPL